MQMTAVAAAAQALFPFTVLLLKPDYIADDFGQHTHLLHVMARERIHAAELAQVQAFNEDGGDPVEIEAAEDYHVLLTLEGHHQDAEQYGPSVPPLSQREKGTTLAALRYWQRHQAQSVGKSQNQIPEDDIATDGGQHQPLSAAEIDALCERINSGEPAPVAPEPSAIGRELLEIANLIDGAIDTHIYDEQNGDEQPEDCPYAASIETLRGLALTIDTVHPALLREAGAVIDSLVHQINQMKGMFHDEDGTISEALSEAEEMSARIAEQHGDHAHALKVVVEVEDCVAKVTKSVPGVHVEIIDRDLEG